MQLNWFLPAEGNRKGKVAKGLPAEEPGLSRRLLERLGSTWAASPVRRLCQATFLILFLVLFFYVCWPGASTNYAESLRARERVEAELFLILDPLVSLSTAIASRTWIWSLYAAGIILAICVFIPRGFCGYVCPMGTFIDLFDWSVGRRARVLGLQGRGWWAHLKYYVLLGVLAASLFGLVLTGFFAAIPVLTRGMEFLLAPLQLGVMRGWHLVPPMHAGHYISAGLFLLVLGLGLLKPRFWCRYVCPTGAVFSIANALRLTQRNVESSCISCGQCVKACPFDAIKPDFTTRAADCTYCQTCGGVCPVGAIRFVPRWDVADRKPIRDLPAFEPALSRRGFVMAAAGSAALVLANRHAFGTQTGLPGADPLIRPPGSVPEAQFLRMCTRCGECLKICPTNVLQPAGFEQGLEGLWTPQAATDWSGCDPNCNNCGQVCPTGAIRALPLDEKRAVRMGLSVVDEKTCLPHAGREDCDLCQHICKTAGHEAIEFIRVGVEMDENGMPSPDSGRLAPMVLAEKCVGCGLCQSRCYSINVKEKRLLRQAAIVVQTGSGREDRLMQGSYLALREAERRQRQTPKSETPTSQKSGGDDYLPDFLK